MSLTSIHKGKVQRTKILQALADHVERHGYPPSIRELGDTVGLSSSSTVHSHLATLERQGLVIRRKGSMRATRLTPAGREALGEPRGHDPGGREALLDIIALAYRAGWDAAPDWMAEGICGEQDLVDRSREWAERALRTLEEERDA